MFDQGSRRLTNEHLFRRWKIHRCSCDQNSMFEDTTEELYCKKFTLMVWKASNAIFLGITDVRWQLVSGWVWDLQLGVQQSVLSYLRLFPS